MTEREVNISELLKAGQEGRQLLKLANVAHATFYTAQRDGQQTVWCGDNVVVHSPKGGSGQLAASGRDLTVALQALFRAASVGSPLIESRPLDGPSNLKIMFRHKDGAFQI